MLNIKKDIGISPVIGIVLLVVITIILASTILCLFLMFLQKLKNLALLKQAWKKVA